MFLVNMLKIFSLNFFRVTFFDDFSEKFSKKILIYFENVVKKSVLVYKMWYGEVKIDHKKLMMFGYK